MIHSLLLATTMTLAPGLSEGLVGSGTHCYLPHNRCQSQTYWQVQRHLQGPVAQIIPDLKQADREWKESWDAYEKEKIRKNLDRVREEFGLFFLAVDTWLAAHSPDWLAAELNTRLREKAIAIYIAENNEDFMRAYRAISAGEWFYFGRTAFSMKRFKSAAANFAKASQLSGGSVDSDYWRTKSLSDDSLADPSQIDAALQALHAFIKKYPSHVMAKYDIARIYARMGKLREAYLHVFLYCVDRETSEGGKNAPACASRQMQEFGREFGFNWDSV
jgi:tetratricopeptide (TPR) repeat protein